MALFEKSSESGKLEGQTPATIVLATSFFLFVLYFVLEIFFMANEYYAGDAPHVVLIMGGVVIAGFVFIFLGKVEPERKDTLSYALLIGFGVGLALYAFIPRMSVIMDEVGVKSYAYALDTHYIWQTAEVDLPELDLYLKNSEWWRQFEPGDQYTFELRKGMFNIWLVDMSKIYDEQKKFYDCNGVLTCMMQ